MVDIYGYRGEATDVGVGEARAEAWARYRATRAIPERDAVFGFYVHFLRVLTERTAAGRMYRHVEADDLFTAGGMGMARCIERFDCRRGVRFGAFAQQRVIGAMFDVARSNSWVKRAGLERGDSRKMYSASTIDAACENATSAKSSADQDYGFGDSALNRYSASRTPDPLDAVAERDTWEWATACLGERERKLFVAVCRDGVSLKEAGIAIGLCESRVSQLIAAARRIVAARAMPLLADAFGDAAVRRPIQTRKVDATRKGRSRLTRRPVLIAEGVLS
jgi:RNA polymerase sigma factor for flagellar operon FliA